MMHFFELAFQQTQVTYTDFADMTYPKQIAINSTTIPLLMQNAQESFARTMLQLIANGQPLTQATTTTQVMMTTAMKELYSFLDVYEVDDNGNVTDGFKVANPKQMITVEAAQGPIAISDTLDPASPNYMHWYNPDVASTTKVAGCQADPLVYGPSSITLHYLLYGSLDGHKLSDGTNCPQVSGTAAAPQLQASDFSDWSLVTLRPPNQGEATATFYDLPTLRTASTLVLNIPRIGFFSTPAFAANWQTNTSNTMRVTMNQTFIVALGSHGGRDGHDEHLRVHPGLDTVHANQAACYGCHKTLWTRRARSSPRTGRWNYHSQLDATYSQQPGVFAFRGVITPVTSIADLGNALATHPYFAPGWVQKLCYYVNSSPCDPTDPAFPQIVSDFTSSNYSPGTPWSKSCLRHPSSPTRWRRRLLSRTVRSSPWPAATTSVPHSNARLGFADVCGLTSRCMRRGQLHRRRSRRSCRVSHRTATDAGRWRPFFPTSRRSSSGRPSRTSASRLPRKSSTCRWPSRWRASSNGRARSRRRPSRTSVSVVMGLTTPDPRTVQASALLTQHYQAALAQKGTTATQALESTFVAALTWLRHSSSIGM